MSGSTSKPAPDFSMGTHPAGYEPEAWHEAAARLRGSAQVAIPPSHHGHDLQHWPLRDTLILGAIESAVPSARAHLRQLLSGWGQAELGPDAGVVVSELVTNSVVASAGLRLAAAQVLVLTTLT